MNLPIGLTFTLLLVVYGALAEERTEKIVAFIDDNVTITCAAQEGLKPAFMDPSKTTRLSPANNEAEDGRYSRDGNYSMVIRSIGDGDAGEWGCSYWMQGAQTYTTEIVVKPRPEVTVETFAREPNSRVKKVASCRVTNVDTDAGYELSWDSSDALEAIDDAAEAVVSSGAVETVLKALTSEDNDDRAIACVYVDVESGRSFEARSLINIKEATTPAPTPPPQVAPSFFGMEQAEQTFEVGATAVLECNADGYPVPKVGWYKNEDPINSVSNANGSRTLTLTNLQYSDSGDYMCHASNIEGTKTFHVQLQVTGKPEVLPHKDAKNNKVEIVLPVQDKFVTLKCSARSNPTPAITWSMGELEKSDDQVETTEDVDEINFTVSSTVRIPATKFVPTKPTMVKCDANTTLGGDSHQYVITKEADTSLGGGTIAIVVIIVVFSLLLAVAALVVVRRRRQQEVELNNEDRAETGCVSTLLCAGGNKPPPPPPTAGEEKEAVEEEDGAVKEELEEGAAGGDSPDAEEKQKLTGATENGEKQTLEGAGEEEQGEEDQMLEKKSASSEAAGGKKKKAKFGGCCVRMRSRKKIQLNEEEDEEDEEQEKAVAEEDAVAQDNKGAEVEEEEEEEKEADNEAATEDKKDHEESDRDSGKGDTLKPNVAPPPAQDDDVGNDDEDSDDVRVVSANNTN